MDERSRPDDGVPVRVTGQTMVSVTLLVALLTVSQFAGRQMQRIDTLEDTLRSTRTEMNQLRGDLQAVRELLLQKQIPGMAVK